MRMETIESLVHQLIKFRDSAHDLSGLAASALCVSLTISNDCWFGVYSCSSSIQLLNTAA